MSMDFGSPPPTRGARVRTRRTNAAIGITPAYAGSTSVRRIQHGGDTDHPRLRGEHLRERRVQSWIAGSPPPTRGALGALFVGDLGLGITPAYAGSTAGTAGRHRRRTDHPRLRGEHD